MGGREGKTMGRVARMGSWPRTCGLAHEAPPPADLQPSGLPMASRIGGIGRASWGQASHARHHHDTLADEPVEPVEPATAAVR